jgi:methyltransferase (TIGR00027 family)
MLDAEKPRPVCNDIYARTFMTDEGLQILAAFKDESRPNAANVARHRIIDDLVREELSKDSSLTVVIIGAGFDSRAFRLEGGSWIELDEPQVIEHKNERLPVSQSPNPVRRIPIDFATESVEQKLSELSQTTPLLIIIEGVFQYLAEEAVVELLRKLRGLFPQHKLICDLMTRDFFENYGRGLHDKINDLGASFKLTSANPEELFLANGHQQLEKISIIEKSIVLETPDLSSAVLETLRSNLPRGYDICVFESVR